MELAPVNISIEIFDLEGITPYNNDKICNPPAKVMEFKEKIRNAKGLLIATPEYNYSIPGVLKNAIDWASRPFQGNPLEDKPVAIMSASTGRLGGARAQIHLRQTFIFLNVHPINQPEVMLSNASENVDGNSKLTNEQTRISIKQLLEALALWIKKLKCKPK